MKKAFTTVELVIIICIIAACTAVVVPLMAGSDNVYTMKCVANGRQIAAAILQYMSDYDGRFPCSATSEQLAAASAKYGTWQYNWEGTGMRTWDIGMAQYRYIQLRKYIKDDSIWVCPNPTALYCKRYAYGYRCSWYPRNSDNFLDGDRGFATSNGLGLTLEEVELLDRNGQTACGPRYMPPNKKILAMCYSMGEWANGVLGTGSFPWIFPSYSHQEGTNFAYADGHVEWKAMGRGWAPIGYTRLLIDSAPSGNYSAAGSASCRKLARKIDRRTVEAMEQFERQYLMAGPRAGDTEPGTAK